MPNRELGAEGYKSKAIFFIKTLKNNLSPEFQEEITKILDWDLKQMDDFQKGNLELDAIQLSKLSSHFNFSLKAFEENRVDFNTVNEQRCGDESSLPRRYTEGPLTLSNVIFNGALEKVEKFFGSDLKEIAINDMQIGNYTFKNPDKFLSIRALVDLFKFLKGYGLNTTDIEYLGACCCRAVLQDPTFEEANKISSNQEFLRFFFGEFVPVNVARHYLFEIKENTENKFILDLKENPEVAKSLFPERIGSPLVCHHMLGGFKNALVHRELDPVASHPKCIHRGDDVCRYHFEF